MPCPYIKYKIGIAEIKTGQAVKNEKRSVAEVLYEDIHEFRTLRAVEKGLYPVSVKRPMVDSKVIGEAGEMVVKAHSQTDP